MRKEAKCGRKRNAAGSQEVGSSYHHEEHRKSHGRHEVRHGNLRVMGDHHVRAWTHRLEHTKYHVLNGLESIALARQSHERYPIMW
jgi:hypothetical protein